MLKSKTKGANVARRVRAWIETRSSTKNFAVGNVARRVRAWIETKMDTAGVGFTLRRPPCAGVD